MLEPLRFRGGGFVIEPKRHAGWIAGFAVIALWQAVSSAGWVSPVFLPSPAGIARALADLALSGQLWRHLSASLRRILLGFALGASAGLAFGLALGLLSHARAAGLPIVSALFPIPKIALLPLFILWFGIGEPSKVATIGLGVFFPMAIATFSGVDQVPRALIRMAQGFDVPTSAIVAKVILPGALPGILAGVRISASIALILVVAAEMIGAEFGVGAFILTAGNLMRTEDLLAGVCLLSLLGLAVGALVSLAERRFLAWR
ncbi:MAG: ABC transporter permease [Alphaproteobacteria bacterium]|nr:ABC transporter permease [Alphaproteobacteria bacterium]